jgi:glycosyltransferase involved in cell wall biosynthesis
MGYKESCWEFSIITPCINRASFILDAVESVKQQQYPNVQHIIIDGGSTDGTIDVLKAHPDLQVISEPDRGLYDALNKGLKIATGDIIGWLNSDDMYNIGAFDLVAESFYSNHLIKAVFGSAEAVGEGDIHNRIRIQSIKIGEIIDRVTLDSFSMNACFFQREVFNIVGNFNLAYPVTSDRDFMFRFGLSNIPYSSLDNCVYTYRRHGNSLTFGNNYQTQCQANIDEMNMALNYYRNLNTAKYRNICRKWYTRASADAFILSTINQDYALAKQMLRSGIKQNPLWLVALSKLLFIQLGRRYASPELRSKFSWLRRYLTRSL